MDLRVIAASRQAALATAQQQQLPVADNNSNINADELLLARQIQQQLRQLDRNRQQIQVGQEELKRVTKNMYRALQEKQRRHPQLPPFSGETTTAQMIALHTFQTIFERYHAHIRYDHK